MKTLFFIASTVLLFSCGNASKESDVNVARQNVLDSVNNATAATVLKQQTIDSMNALAAEQEAAMRSQEHQHQNATNVPEEKKKKGMNNTTKGAIIGGGAGAVTGAVTGAVISKDKGKGAVIGGVIGAATGAGVGAVTGKQIDKKKAKENK